jgi:membrane fusion protein, multidrug efflux system
MPAYITDRSVINFSPEFPMSPRLLVPLAAAFLLLTCGKQPAPQQEVLRPVRVIELAPESVGIVAELAGDVRPRVESRVGFQVGGRIVTRRVEVGQTVTRGQVLALLDAQDLKLAANAAGESVNAARIDAEQQRADYRRFTELRTQNFISEADLQRRRSALDAAEARYAQAVAQAQVSGNQAGYGTLVAPTAGVVTAIDAEAGQVVAAGQSVVRIAQTAEKEVEIGIPESQLAALRSARDVTVSLWAQPGTLRGRVREVAPAADPATRTYMARITLIDPPAAVAFGMTATVRLAAAGTQPALTVPLTALLREGGASHVWLLDRSAMTVSRTAVQVAGVDGNDAVLATGVKPGDLVVTAGVHLLRQGQKVRLLESGVTAPRAEPQVAKKD